MHRTNNLLLLSHFGPGTAMISGLIIMRIVDMKRNLRNNLTSALGTAFRSWNRPFVHRVARVNLQPFSRSVTRWGLIGL
jgi:hypothetical protein